MSNVLRPPTVVAIYARLSVNPDGRSDSVATQVTLCEAYAAELFPGSLTVAFRDDGRSAANPDVRRPGYEAMLDAVRAGEVGAIVAADQSRLTRQDLQWAELGVICNRVGITHVHLARERKAVELDAIEGKIIALVRAEEAKATRIRVRSTLAQRAKERRPIGGRSYGYRRTIDADHRKRMEPDPIEADEIRRMAKAVLAGEGLMSIARDLNDRGVPTATKPKEGQPPRQWMSSTVRSVLTSASVTGLRVYQGQIIGEGEWEPILDRETWNAVGAILSAPRMVTGADGRTVLRGTKQRTPRRYVLSGGLTPAVHENS